MLMKECKVYAIQEENIKKSFIKTWEEHENNLIETMLEEDDAGKQLDKTYSEQEKMKGFGINYEYVANKDVMYDGDGNTYVIDNNENVIKVEEDENKHETCKGVEVLNKYNKDLNKG